MDKNQYLDEQIELLGLRIKRVRIQLGYTTQYAFVKVYTGSEKRSSIISRLESGANIDFTTAIKLVTKFKISLLNLFDFGNQFKINIDNPIPDMAQELQKLGKRIYVLRIERKLTQSDLAEKAEISDTQLSLFENGKEMIEFKTIASIAYGLGVEIWELFWNGKEKRNK